VNDKLGLEEYSVFVLESISKVIINRNYIEENEDFFNVILFKFWEEYYTSIVEPISISKQVKMLDILLYALITEKPSVDLPEDSI
jgi:hypothetical protein